MLHEPTSRTHTTIAGIERNPPPYPRGGIAQAAQRASVFVAGQPAVARSGRGSRGIQTAGSSIKRAPNTKPSLFPGRGRIFLERLLGKKQPIELFVRIGSPIYLNQPHSFEKPDLLRRYLRSRIYALGTPLEPSSFFRVPLPGFQRIEHEETGQARDLDEYDLYYKQLIIWDKRNQQIAGGYVRIRFGQPIIHEHSETLRQTCQQWLDEALLPMRQNWVALSV